MSVKNSTIRIWIVALGVVGLCVWAYLTLSVRDPVGVLTKEQVAVHSDALLKHIKAQYPQADIVYMPEGLDLRTTSVRLPLEYAYDAQDWKVKEQPEADAFLRSLKDDTLVVGEDYPGRLNETTHSVLGMRSKGYGNALLNHASLAAAKLDTDAALDAIEAHLRTLSAFRLLQWARYSVEETAQPYAIAHLNYVLRTEPSPAQTARVVDMLLKYDQKFPVLGKNALAMETLQKIQPYAGRRTYQLTNAVLSFERSLGLTTDYTNQKSGLRHEFATRSYEKWLKREVDAHPTLWRRLSPLGDEEAAVMDGFVQSMLYFSLPYYYPQIIDTTKPVQVCDISLGYRLEFIETMRQEGQPYAPDEQLVIRRPNIYAHPTVRSEQQRVKLRTMQVAYAAREFYFKNDRWPANIGELAGRLPWIGQSEEPYAPVDAFSRENVGNRIALETGDITTSHSESVVAELFEGVNWPAPVILGTANNTTVTAMLNAMPMLLEPSDGATTITIGKESMNPQGRKVPFYYKLKSNADGLFIKVDGTTDMVVPKPKQ